MAYFYACSVEIKRSKADGRCTENEVVNKTIDWLRHFFNSSPTTAVMPVLPPLCALMTADNSGDSKGKLLS